MNDTPVYVIWEKLRQRWWRPYRQGYTPNLLEAGVYTAEQLKEANLQAEDLARPLDEVLAEFELAGSVGERMLAEHPESLAFYALAIEPQCGTEGCTKLAEYAVLILDSEGRPPLSAHVCREHCKSMRNDVTSMGHEAGGEVEVTSYGPEPELKPEPGHGPHAPAFDALRKTIFEGMALENSERSATAMVLGQIGDMLMRGIEPEVVATVAASLGAGIVEKERLRERGPEDVS